MIRRLCALSAAAAALLAALAAGPASAFPACDQSPPVFRAPVRMGTTGVGYEPGIDIDSAGVIYTTAHKLNLVREEGTRLSSFLWRSTDGGLTFQDMTGGLDATRSAYALEGDLAIDALDRVYFVDTWAADNHFYRFSDHGATLDLFRPAVAGYEVDDRPWLAAHHDGYVYYLSNTGYKHDGRLTVHRSTNGGLTFDPVGYTFPFSGWGFVDADPNSDYVYAFVNDLFYGPGILGGATKVLMWVSSDRGSSWLPVDVAPYDLGYQVTEDHDDAYPVVAVSPADGSVYGLWTDDGRKLKLARSTDHGATWTVYDITPFSGIFSFPWVAVSPDGTVGITFTGQLGVSSQAYVYGMTWHPSPLCTRADSSSCTAAFGEAFARLRPQNVGGFNTQADFNQTEFSPDGSLNAVFTGADHKLWHVRQTAGPGLSGGPPCGIVGSA